MSQLKITYQDKTTRVINLHPDFFLKTDVMNTRTRKSEPITVQEKAKSLALSYGAKPYHIVLTRGDKTMMDHINRENAPRQPQKQVVQGIKDKRFKRHVKKHYPKLQIEQA
jgi:hypothetical protein